MPDTTAPPLQRRAYRLAEIASMLGVSVKTLRRACEAGDLTYFRVGATILVAAEDLDAYIKSRKQSKPTPT
jgi:excisionase family DNA binding protein